MKRFLIQIAIYIPFMILFYVIGIWILGEFVPSYLRPNIKYTRGSGGYTYTRLQEVKQGADIDILFLGSSHTYRGFDTRLFNKIGLKAFNLGTSAQTPIQTKLLIEKYLTIKNPEIVILQVSPFMFATKGVESSVDILSNDNVDIKSFQMAIDINDIKTYNMLIFSLYKNSIIKRDEDEQKGSRRDIYIPGGYVESYNRRYNNIKSIETDFELNKLQLEKFNNIISMLSKKRIKVYLVQTPITGKLYKKIQCNSKFDSIMISYGYYYNFNKLLNLNEDSFLDSHHLNKKGVKIFNSKLIEVLKLDTK